MTTATDILAQARDYIAENGLHKGYFFDMLGRSKKVCAIGAINVVANGDPACGPSYRMEGSPEREEQNRARVLLGKAFSQLPDRHQSHTVAEYNDHSDTTQDDVIALFNAAIEIGQKK